MKFKVDVIVARVRGGIYEGRVTQQGVKGKSMKLGSLGDPYVLRQNVHRHLVREFGSDTVGDMDVTVHLPHAQGYPDLS